VCVCVRARAAISGGLSHALKRCWGKKKDEFWFYHVSHLVHRTLGYGSPGSCLKSVALLEQTDEGEEGILIGS
jgi:hypothetical protein